jgi:hypothetical protein
LRPPFGLTIAPATYWGVAGVVGVLVPPRWCQNDAQQVFTKTTDQLRPCVCVCVFFVRPLGALAKQSMYLLFLKCILGAFFGKRNSKTRETKRNHFLFRDICFGCFFSPHFVSFDFLLLRWLSASR